MNESLDKRKRSELDISNEAEQILSNAANTINEIEISSKVEAAVSSNFYEAPPTREEELRQQRKIKLGKNEYRNFTRYTEPKHRSFLKRARIRKKLRKGDYDYIKEYRKKGYISAEELEKMKYSTKRKERKFYKEVQDYEDATEDVKIDTSWGIFKTSLAMLAISGLVTFGAWKLCDVKDVIFPPHSTEIVQQEKNEEEKIAVEEQVRILQQEVIERDGYHFDHLSEKQLVEAYSKIMEYEKKLTENTFRAAANRIFDDGDQELLETIAKESLPGKYSGLSSAEKRDILQLAFELLRYALPDIMQNPDSKLRNPIVMDELRARNAARENGYVINLRVNGDEKETVRILGNILHVINGFSSDDYYEAGSQNDGQDFLDNILKEVAGENLEGIELKSARDYKQIIYQWLPIYAKNHIKNPIVVDRENEFAQRNNSEEFGER